MFVVLFAHTVTVFVDAANTPTPPPTVRPANTPTTSITPTERREYDRDLGKRLIGHPTSPPLLLNTRSKKRRFAFQTFTETPANTPSTLGFGITHQPHEGGGWCEMWCEIRRHTSRHQSRGYWRASRVERAPPKGLHLKNIFLCSSRRWRPEHN